MTTKANYGIDAPGVVRTLIAAGLLSAIAAPAAFAQRFPAPLNVAASIIAAACLLYAAVMLRSSLVGKRRLAERLAAELALSGSERVLDAGCGRGLALIACAKKLTTGKAVGIDLWSAKDLSRNNPDAARANAAAEGVAERVEIDTGDITALPYPDASFDAIISMTVIHNISPRSRRDQALRELTRVLKPGGRMAIFDLVRASRYTSVLQQAGLAVRELAHHRLWLLSGRSLIAEKPGIRKGAQPPYRERITGSLDAVE